MQGMIYISRFWLKSYVFITMLFTSHPQDLTWVIVENAIYPPYSDRYRGWQNNHFLTVARPRLFRFFFYLNDIIKRDSLNPCRYMTTDNCHCVYDQMNTTLFRCVLLPNFGHNHYALKSKPLNRSAPLLIHSYYLTYHRIAIRLKCEILWKVARKICQFLFHHDHVDIIASS